MTIREKKSFRRWLVGKYKIPAPTGRFKTESSEDCLRIIRFTYNLFFLSFSSFNSKREIASFSKKIGQRIRKIRIKIS